MTTLLLRQRPREGHPGHRSGRVALPECDGQMSFPHALGADRVQAIIRPPRPLPEQEPFLSVVVGPALWTALLSLAATAAWLLVHGLRLTA